MGTITFCWLSTWAGCFLLTHIPISPAAQAPLGQGDKVIHFTFYFTIAALGGHRLRRLRRDGGRKVASAIWAWALAYLCWAVLDEWTQQFVGRTPSVGDFLADAAGVVAASFWVWQRTRQRELSDPTQPKTGEPR